MWVFTETAQETVCNLTLIEVAHEMKISTEVMYVLSVCTDHLDFKKE